MSCYGVTCLTHYLLLITTTTTTKECLIIELSYEYECKLLFQYFLVKYANHDKETIVIDKQKFISKVNM